MTEPSMPPLPIHCWARDLHGETEVVTVEAMHAYAQPLLERIKELEAGLSRSRSALESISEMTYDSWTNGARAKQIADAAISTKEKP